MDSIWLEIVKSSPLIGGLLWFLWVQKKDYKELVVSTTEQHKEREKEMRGTIDKNQNIIQENQKIMQENQSIIKDLTQSFGVIKDVSEDVKSVKVDMTIMKNDIEDLKRK